MIDLENQIKQLIIDSLDLEDMTIEDIDCQEPLFVDGLGLDSIDALELGLAIKNEFQVSLEATSEDTKRHFYSVATLADFIRSSK